MRDFLSSSNETITGFHWVNWGEVCYSKQEEGLGIRPLRHMSKALKTKWLWPFAKGEEALWENVIKAKFGFTVGVGGASKATMPLVGRWKSILAGLERFISLVRFEV